MKISRKDHRKDKSKRKRIYRTGARKTLHDYIYGSERRSVSNALAKLKYQNAKYLLLCHSVIEENYLDELGNELSEAVIRGGYISYELD